MCVYVDAQAVFHTPGIRIDRTEISLEGITTGLRLLITLASYPQGFGNLLQDWDSLQFLSARDFQDVT